MNSVFSNLNVFDFLDESEHNTLQTFSDQKGEKQNVPQTPSKTWAEIFSPTAPIDESYSYYPDFPQLTILDDLLSCSFSDEDQSSSNQEFQTTHNIDEPPCIKIKSSKIESQLNETNQQQTKTKSQKQKLKTSIVMPSRTHDGKQPLTLEEAQAMAQRQEERFLPPGWSVRAHLRRDSRRINKTWYSPDGVKFRSRKDIFLHLKNNGEFIPDAYFERYGRGGSYAQQYGDTKSEVHDSVENTELETPSPRKKRTYKKRTLDAMEEDISYSPTKRFKSEPHSEDEGMVDTQD